MSENSVAAAALSASAISDTGPGQCQVLRDPADRSITVGVKRYRTKTETHAYR
jgi:hypothetical protein